MNICFRFKWKFLQQMKIETRMDWRFICHRINICFWANWNIYAFQCWHTWQLESEKVFPSRIRTSDVGKLFETFNKYFRFELCSNVCHEKIFWSRSRLYMRVSDEIILILNIIIVWLRLLWSTLYLTKTSKIWLMSRYSLCIVSRRI